MRPSVTHVLKNAHFVYGRHDENVVETIHLSYSRLQVRVVRRRCLYRTDRENQGLILELNILVLHKERWSA